MNTAVSIIQLVVGAMVIIWLVHKWVTCANFTKHVARIGTVIGVALMIVFIGASVVTALVGIDGGVDYAADQGKVQSRLMNLEVTSKALSQQDLDRSAAYMDLARRVGALETQQRVSMGPITTNEFFWIAVTNCGW